MSYSNGRSYGGRRFGEKVKWRKKRWVEERRPRMRLDKDLKLLGCWMFNFAYPIINGERLHVKFCSPREGEVIRHLCGYSGCVQRYHLRKGSLIENAFDELDVVKMGVVVLRKMTGESHSEAPPDIECLALQQRVVLEGRYGFQEPKDVRIFIRETFRRNFELSCDIREMDMDLLRKDFFSIERFIDVEYR